MIVGALKPLCWVEASRAPSSLAHSAQAETLNPTYSFGRAQSGFGVPPPSLERDFSN
jgi:hypothetical protein